MKKKNKFFLALGYVAGAAMALSFSKKKSANKKDVSFGESFKTFARKFFRIHKNAFESAKDEYWTPENKKKLEKFVQEFRDDAGGKIAELKDSGVDLAKKGEDELREIFDNRVELLEKAKDLGGQGFDVAKEALEDAFYDVLGNIKKKVAAKAKAPAKKKTTKKK